MTEGEVNLEEQYPEHYPSASRMDNRRSDRETSKDTLRSILTNDLTGNSYVELRREGNARVGQYNLSGMPRNRRLEALTYAVASGLQIVYANEENFVTRSESLLEFQTDAPYISNRTKEEGFDKEYESALSTQLKVVGGTQVRGYDLTVSNSKESIKPEVIKANAKLLGWGVAWEANNMLIIRRNTQVLANKAA